MPRIAGTFRCLKSFDWEHEGKLMASYQTGLKYTIRAGPEHEAMQNEMEAWIDQGRFEAVWINAPHLGFENEVFK